MPPPLVPAYDLASDICSADFQAPSVTHTTAISALRPAGRARAGLYMWGDQGKSVASTLDHTPAYDIELRKIGPGNRQSHKVPLLAPGTDVSPVSRSTNPPTYGCNHPKYYIRQDGHTCIFQFLWEEKFFPNYIISPQDDLSFHHKRLSLLPRMFCESVLREDPEHMALFLLTHHKHLGNREWRLSALYHIQYRVTVLSYA